MATNPASTTPVTIDELGNGKLEVWRLSTDENFLCWLFADLFINHWQEIQYGMLVQGGVLEFTPPCAPTKCGYLDGYLTIEFGPYGHLHLCLGLSDSRTPEAVSQLRRPSKVELYRKLSRATGEPTAWGLRTFNSRQPEPEQTMHIYLPNPLLVQKADGSMDYADQPDWSRLSLWYYLRNAYLGIAETDPKDCLAKRFMHD